MKKVIMAVAALPFLTGVATAGQPLTDQQLDRVTAGFTAPGVQRRSGRADRPVPIMRHDRERGWGCTECALAVE